MELGVITVRCGGMMQDVEHVKCGAMSCVKCGVMRDVVVCINGVANIWCDPKCGRVHGMWRYVEHNVKWGAMRDVV